MKRLAWAMLAAIVVAIVVIAAPQSRGLGISAHERSDRFWRPLGIWNGSWGADYPSLGALVEGAHVVVRGRLTDVTAGRVFGSDAPSDELVTMAQLNLKVTERIKWDSRLDPGDLLYFEVVKPTAESIDVLRDGLPSEEAVFFLRNRALAAEEEQLAPEIVAQRWTYFQQVNNMGVFRDIDSQVHRPPDGEQAWLDRINGMSYLDFVDTVRTIASSQSVR